MVSPQYIDVYENWYRLHTLDHHAVRPTLREVFHGIGNGTKWKPIHNNGNNFPTNEKQLYHELQTHYMTDIQKLKKQKVINDDQYNLIFPPSGNTTNTDNFDASLLVTLIRNLMNPSDGSSDWSKNAHKLKYNKSDSAAIDCLRLYRNKIVHSKPETFNDHQEFQKVWDEGKHILTCNSLASTVNFTELKTLDLERDGYTKHTNSRLERLQTERYQFNPIFVSIIVVVITIGIYHLCLTSNRFNIQDLSVDGNKISFTILVENNVTSDDLDIDSEYSMTLEKRVEQFLKGYFERQSYLVQIDDAGMGRDFKLLAIELRFDGKGPEKIPDDFSKKYSNTSKTFRRRLKKRCLDILKELKIPSTVSIRGWKNGSLIVTVELSKELGRWEVEEEQLITTILHGKNFSVSGLRLTNIRQISSPHDPYFRFEVIYFGKSTICLPFLRFYLLTRFTVSWFIFSVLFTILLSVLLSKYFILQKYKTSQGYSDHFLNTEKTEQSNVDDDQSLENTYSNPVDETQMVSIEKPPDNCGSSRNFEKVEQPIPVSYFNAGFSGMYSHAGPAGSQFHSIEHAGRHMLKVKCDNYPMTTNSYILPPIFLSKYPEGNDPTTSKLEPRVAPPLSGKEQKKLDGIRCGRGEQTKYKVFNLFTKLLKKEQDVPVLVLRDFELNTKGKGNLKRKTLMSEYPHIRNIDMRGQQDCIIFLKDLGFICIEIKRSLSAHYVQKAKDLLDRSESFLNDIMPAIAPNSYRLPISKLIMFEFDDPQHSLPSNSPGYHFFDCSGDSIVAFKLKWKELKEELQSKLPANPLTSLEFKRLARVLTGLWSMKSINRQPYFDVNDASVPHLTTQIAVSVAHAHLSPDNQQETVFREANEINLMYLTPEQKNVYENVRCGIIRGAAGTGKTLLILFKIIDLVQSHDDRKLIILLAPHPHTLRCRNILEANGVRVVESRDFPPAAGTLHDVVVMDIPNLPSVLSSNHHLFIDEFHSFASLARNIPHDVEVIKRAYQIAAINKSYFWCMDDTLQQVSMASKPMEQFYSVLFSTTRDGETIPLYSLGDYI